MLANYIGQGRYEPKRSVETHSAWFYVWVTASGLLLFGLTMWLTIYLLTR